MPAHPRPTRALQWSSAGAATLLLILWTGSAWWTATINIDRGLEHRQVMRA
jgi:hypothetical protein